MPPRKAAAPSRVYQLKLTLKGSKPPIWRRVEVAEDVTLAKLHHSIQAAMGWTDTHLHMFSFGRVSDGVPDPDYDEDVRDERRYKLSQLLVALKEKLFYEYDCARRAGEADSRGVLIGVPPCSALAPPMVDHNACAGRAMAPNCPCAAAGSRATMLAPASVRRGAGTCGAEDDHGWSGGPS